MQEQAMHTASRRPVADSVRVAMRRKETVVCAYVSVAARRAALSSAIAGLLLSGCAEVVHSPAKQSARGARVAGVSYSQPRPARDVEVVAAARPPAKAPQPAAPPPPDILFDSRRIEAVGTLLIEDIMPLIRQAPRLKDEVDAALRESDKKAQEITCIGRRIDGSWKHLAGARVQPYACKIGERWLEITAELRISGASGEHYSTVSDLAAQNAKSIKETNPRWTWTTTKPRDWFLE